MLTLMKAHVNDTPELTWNPAVCIPLVLRANLTPPEPARSTPRARPAEAPISKCVPLVLQAKLPPAPPRIAPQAQPSTTRPVRPQTSTHTQPQQQAAAHKPAKPTNARAPVTLHSLSHKRLERDQFAPPGVTRPTAPKQAAEDHPSAPSTTIPNQRAKTSRTPVGPPPPEARAPLPKPDAVQRRTTAPATGPSPTVAPSRAKAAADSKHAALKAYNLKYRGLATTKATPMSGKSSASSIPHLYESLNRTVHMRWGDEPGWKAALPTRAQLQNTSFGRPSVNHSFTQEAAFETCMHPILLSGYLDLYSFTALCCITLIIAHIVKMIVLLFDYDFTWLI
ncbi:hypothetical protein ACHAWF_008926 [Thalassiosira exigua]